MPERTRLLILVGLALLCAQESAAHTALPGIEGFYSGLVHPVMEPAQGLAVFIAGMLSARAGPDHASGRLQALLGAVLVGMAGGWLAGAPASAIATTLTLPAVMICALLITALRAPPAGMAHACTLPTGLLIGINALPEPGAGMVLTTSGSLAGAVFLLIVASGCTIWTDRQARTISWLDLAPRVAGSWCLAVCLLLFAFALRPVAGGP